MQPPLVLGLAAPPCSSIVEMAGLETYASSLSYGPKKRVWPFTMQDGVPISCQPTEPYASCDISERYQGMWEVPGAAQLRVWRHACVAERTLLSTECGARHVHRLPDLLLPTPLACLPAVWDLHAVGAYTMDYGA